MLKRHADGEDNHWPCKHSSSFAPFLPLVLFRFAFVLSLSLSLPLFLPLPASFLRSSFFICVQYVLMYVPVA